MIADFARACITHCSRPQPNSTVYGRLTAEIYQTAERNAEGVGAALSPVERDLSAVKPWCHVKIKLF